MTDSDNYYEDQRVADAYDAEQTGREITTEDVPFYVGLAQEAAAAGQSVLELACGTGRVTLPIAQAGIRVVGVDRSAAMLTVAQSKTANRDNPRWVEAGMTDFELEERFGLVIIPFRSFCLLLSVAEQKACLRRIHDHLVEGGRLALNFFNPDLTVIASWLTDRRGLWQREDRAAYRERWLTRDYLTSSQQLHETRAEIELTDAGAVIARVERNLRLRYIFRYEMEHLLTLSGFEVEALYGWFDRRPFDDASDEMVWLARKLSTT